MPYTRKIVYLTEEQRNTLVTEGSITVDGVTVVYNENDIYLTPQDAPLTDVQINGTSVVSGGVANVPLASDSVPGVMRVNANDYGIGITSNGMSYINKASAAQRKAGTGSYRPVCPVDQHESAFYGLAKAAGDSTQSASENPVGTYTDEAKSAIKTMLGISDIPELDIATEEETQAIIDEYGGASADALIVEMVFYDDGDYDKGFESEISAAEIGEAFASGSRVLLHINAEEAEVSNYYVQRDSWLEVIGYNPEFTPEEGSALSHSPANFIVTGSGNINNPYQSYSGLGWFSGTSISEDGKLRLVLYID